MTAIITRDELRTITPSVFATTPFHAMSPRYKFVGTDGVLDIMEGLGFRPVMAMQGRSRIEEKLGYTRHFIRLRHLDHLTNPSGEEVPEIVLENPHDGTAAYRLHAGIYRFICSNGLLIASANFGTISVKHAGGRDFESRITEATRQIAEHTPAAFEMVERWKSIILPRSMQIEMAQKAFDLKPIEGVRPAALLTARREEDYTDREGGRDLYRTFNVLQENTLRGGVQGVNPRGRKTRTRSIRSVSATITLNQKLWQIAEQTAEWN
ncbi:MAG: DUF932 domain-containing protein [Isosphaeraceae bacterium]